MDTNQFDTFFTTSQLQILKIILPFFPPPLRKDMAIFIKMQELSYTLQYFKVHPEWMPDEPAPSEGTDLMDAILPYCTEEQKSEISRMRQTYEQFGQMQEMMEMVQMLQELFPGGMNPQDMDYSQLSELLGGLH